MQSVRRSLLILEAVSRHQPVGVGELSRLVALPKTTVQRSLTTLAEAGWLRPVGTDLTRWALTSKALAVGRRGSQDVDIREAAIGPMQHLRDQVNETIHLWILDEGWRTVLIQRTDCTQAVRTFHKLGTSVPIHASSTGRCILANLGPEAIEEVLTGPLERCTNETLVDPIALRLELANVRQQGFAVNYHQFWPGVAAVGAPIFDSGNNPIAALCISMPDSRFNSEKVPYWAELVIKTATHIGNSIAAP